MSTNFAKTLLWKHEYHMSLNEPPHENLLRTPMTSTQYRHDIEALRTSSIKM